jgi:hypothetical protein
MKLTFKEGRFAVMAAVFSHKAQPQSTRTKSLDGACPVSDQNKSMAERAEQKRVGVQ